MARKNTFSMDNMGQWPKLFKKLPARQQQAVYMIFACVLVFLIVVIASTMLIFGGKKDNKDPSSSLLSSGVNNVDSGYNKDAGSIDADKYAGVLLPQSSDAGQSYLDDTLFIGDSNTVRLHDVYKLIPLKNYMGMVGMTIQGAVSAPCVFFENDVTVYTIPKAIAKVQPRRVLMCFGTNNADGNTSAEAFIKHYKAAIQEVQSAYQYADIIITAIPPCGLERDYPNVSQKTIDEFNKALIKMCEDLELKFLNIAETLKDSSTGYIKTSYISGDGLHLNDVGDKAWIDYVRTHAYLTEDKRPALKDIPVRQEPPAPVAGTPVAPTCTANGYTPYTLWNGTVDKRDIVLELGHDYKDGVCTRCAEKDPNYKAPSSSSSSSSSHVHNYTTLKETKVQPTCTGVGKGVYECSTKDGATQEKDIAALGHDFTDATKATCKRCTEKNPNYKPAHTHDFTDTTKPTCAGCTEPNPNYKPPHTHDFTDTTKPTCAGCTEPNPNYKPPHTHDFTDTTKPTCAGCTEPNPNYKPPHTHDFTDTTKPTCAGCTEPNPNYVAPTPPPAA